MIADPRLVVAIGPTRPLIGAEVRCRHPHLVRDETDRGIRHLRLVTWEAAVLDIELQQQDETEPGCTPLPRRQTLLVIQQRPVLNQLIDFD